MEKPSWAGRPANTITSGTGTGERKRRNEYSEQNRGRTDVLFPKAMKKAGAAAGRRCRKAT